MLKPQRPWYRRRWVQLLGAVQALLLLIAAPFGVAFYQAVIQPDRPQPTWEGPLTEEQRRIIFEALWREVDRRYPYLALKGIDWPAARERYWPEAEDAPDDPAYYRVLERMVASLNDGHSSLTWYPGKAPQTAPPLALGWVEEQFVVLRVGTALAAQVQPGDLLLTIDGQPALAVAEAYQPYIGEATAISRNLRTARLLLAGPPGTPVELRLRRSGGEEVTVILERPQPSSHPTSPDQSDSPVRAHKVEGFGYIRIDRWGGQVVPAFDQALEGFHDAPGLILDVRGNGGGNDGLATQVAGRLVSKKELFSRVTFRTYPFWTPTFNRYVKPRGPWTFTGPVALLIDGSVYSSNDFFVGGLARSGRVTTIGSPTGGGSGNPAVITLPGGAKLRLSRWIEYFADGSPVEGSGTRPEILVNPTIADIAAGRDPVLEQAVTILRSATTP